MRNVFEDENENNNNKSVIKLEFGWQISYPEYERTLRFSQKILDQC